MALARAENLSFAYPASTAPALQDVSAGLTPGQVTLVLGRSGSGKSTLLRAFAGLVPHFHGGRFSGRVEVAGLDTRRHGPARLAGTVATLFQDPEEQVVFTRVLNEVAFGKNYPSAGAQSIATLPLGDDVDWYFGSATAFVEPSQWGVIRIVGNAYANSGDPKYAQAMIRFVRSFYRTAARPPAQRPKTIFGAYGPWRGPNASGRIMGGYLPATYREIGAAACVTDADRVMFLKDGRLAFDGPVGQARAWLEEHQPLFVSAGGDVGVHLHHFGEVTSRLDEVSYAYEDHLLVVDRASLELRRGEIVALVGPNGSGKTTLAKLAAGLLEPLSGHIERRGRATYLSQDPGRYVLRERADEEVAIGVDGDLAAASRALAAVGLAGFEDRHPRDLSSGERERLALAAVLASEPDLLVLDEPTRGVDPERKHELAALLRANTARATLVVTHDRAFAKAAADRVVSLAPDRELVHA